MPAAPVDRWFSGNWWKFWAPHESGGTGGVIAGLVLCGLPILIAIGFLVD